MVKNTVFPPGPAFPELLLRWNARENDRQMPWKGIRDPYLVWLSEIMLQQTRVEQGTGYFNRFRAKYPTVTDLAAAPDDEVMKLWEGLGYYSRCRNLLATARTIATEYNGRFPSTYDKILALKGIGPYTAAAISSFSFGLPHAVVDGNVFRVLARVFGVYLATDSTAGKKFFTALAAELLDKNEPAVYNQAIMDFGALICKPAVPLCHKCIFNQVCYAYREKAIDDLPVKEKKTKIRKRWFYYLVMQRDGQTVIRQRTEKGIWQQLYEFPVIETENESATGEVLLQAEEMGLIRKGTYRMVSVSSLMKQQLSHQLIMGRFIRIEMQADHGGSGERTDAKEGPAKRGSGKPGPAIGDSAPVNEPNVHGGRWIDQKDLGKYAFPKFINQYLDNPEAQELF